MTIYIGLLLMIILSHFFIYSLHISNELKKECFLVTAFTLLFLLFALRSPSVGRDVLGYKYIYEYTKSVAFSNFDYVYFEYGYTLLMKICVKLNMSFQGFLTLVSGISLFPIYILFKKYSKQPLISVLIYICYIYLDFYLTGLRQAISISICALAFVALMECKKHPIIVSLILTTISVFFHRGGAVFYIYIASLIIKNFKSSIYATFSLSAVVLLIRSNLIKFVKDLFGKDSMNEDAGLYIGLNLIFLSILAVFFIFTVSLFSKHQSSSEVLPYNGSKFQPQIDQYAVRLFLLSITIMLLFGSETSARSYFNLNFIIMILLPNYVAKYERNIRFVMSFVIVLFLLVFFYLETLSTGGFDIVPYKFFWQ